MQPCLNRLDKLAKRMKVIVLRPQRSNVMVLSDTERCQSSSTAGFLCGWLSCDAVTLSSPLLCEERLFCEVTQSPSSIALTRAASLACLRPEIMIEEVKPYTTFHAFSTSGVKASARSSAKVIFTAFPRMG